MCGRFTVTLDPKKVEETFNVTNVPEVLPPRYNVAPMQTVATIMREEANVNAFAWMKWGLVPSWAKDAKGGGKMINARAEGIDTKPAFRSAIKRRRCLILTNGFYEWRKNADDSKTPMFISLADDEPFGFAGLWERWTDPETGEILTTCSVITTEPNDLMAKIHNRMPVILPREAHDLWLDYKMMDTSKVMGLLKPYPAAQMKAYEVSTKVNNARNEGADLIQPVQ